jgi:hypothetical protein
VLLIQDEAAKVEKAITVGEFLLEEIKSLWHRQGLWDPKRIDN